MLYVWCRNRAQDGVPSLVVGATKPTFRDRDNIEHLSHHHHYYFSILFTSGLEIMNFAQFEHNTCSFQAKFCPKRNHLFISGKIIEFQNTFGAEKE